MTDNLFFVLGVLTFWACMYNSLVYDTTISCSLRRPCTQANLDARAALAGEGRQQRRTRRSNGGEVNVFWAKGRRVGAGGRRVGAPVKLRLLLFCVASVLIYSIDHNMPWKVLREPSLISVPPELNCGTFLPIRRSHKFAAPPWECRILELP